MSRVLPSLAAASLVLVPLDAFATPPIKVDVLFVVDNSGSMADEQASLAANFPRFMDELAGLPGGLPDLHLAVISTSMGSGGLNVPGCENEGDHGLFQNTARADACAPLADRFITDQPGGEDASRVRNYEGSLQDAFSCIARLGDNGCGFEQPLASLQRALDGSNPENAGFLRDDAYLAVVVLADEDDCSASDPTVLFSPAPEANQTLGPLASFRCTRFGVSCDGAPIGSTAATYQACEPTFDSEHLVSPATYVDFLNGLKANPSHLLVAAIVGNASPVSVSVDPDRGPELVPTCAGSEVPNIGGGADPAVRTTWFATQFTPEGMQPNVRSICDADLSGALSSVGSSFRRAIIGSGTNVAPAAASGCRIAPGTSGGRGAAGALAGLALVFGLAFSSRRARRS